MEERDRSLRDRPDNSQGPAVNHAPLSLFWSIVLCLSIISSISFCYVWIHSDALRSYVSPLLWCPVALLVLSAWNIVEHLDPRVVPTYVVVLVLLVSVGSCVTVATKVPGTPTGGSGTETRGSGSPFDLLLNVSQQVIEETFKVGTIAPRDDGL